MERLTEYDYEQVVLKGLNIVGIGEKNADILVEGIKKLADYEDTGLPPEEIEQLMKTCHTAVQLWDNTAKRNCDLYDEIEYWKGQSITDKSNLGILRYYFEKHGTTLDKVLEDCKTMFPNTK